MDLTSLVNAALNLGVIPALALFLVLAMHRQNKQLTDMIAEREKANNEMIRSLVTEMIQFSKAFQK